MDKQDLRTVVVSALTAVAVSVIFEVGSGVISFLRSGWSESAASQPSEQQRRRARAMRPPDMMEYHSRMGGGWREYYDSPELQAKEQERQKLLLEIATLAGESVQFGNVTLKEVWEKRRPQGRQSGGGRNSQKPQFADRRPQGLKKAFAAAYCGVY